MGYEERGELQGAPGEFAPLIGREASCEAIRALIAEPGCRLLTLAGEGGIGKTRLAAAVAHSLASTFQHGACFVALAGITAREPADCVAAVAAAVGDALKFTSSAPQPPAELLIGFLSGKSMLLVLDNMEMLKPAGVWLARIVRGAPGVKLLVTSRERLGQAMEWLYPVPGLAVETSDGSPSPAERLFAECARRLKPGFNADTDRDTVRRICLAVDGSPLAIELAASWIDVLPAEEIARRILLSLDILATRAAGFEPRHASIRTVLDDSWGLLNSAEQQAMAHLSVFRGGFSTEAAERGADATLTRLAALADKSWIGRDGARFSLHEVLRQYAGEKLESAQADEALDRHARFFAEFLAARSAALQPGERPAIAEVDQEIENVRAAWQHIVQTGQVEANEELIEALWHYLRHKGRFQEAVLVLDQAFAVSPAKLGRWRLWAAIALYQMGRLEACERYALEALSALGEKVPTSLAGSLRSLATELGTLMLRRLRALSATAPSAEQASALGDTALAYHMMGQINYFRGRLLALSGLDYASRERNRAEESGRPPAIASAHGALTLGMGSIPWHGAAVRHMAIAKTAIQSEPGSLQEALACHVIGIYLTAGGRWEEGKTHFERAIRLLRQHALPRYERECQSLVGKLDYCRGQFRIAFGEIEKMSEIAREIGDPYARHWNLIGLAETQLRLGDQPLDEILALLDEAEQTRADVDRTETVRMYGLRAWCEWRRGNEAAALNAARSVLAVHEQDLLCGFYAYEGYAEAAEVFLAAAANRRAGSAEASGLERVVKTALAAFAGFARHYPFARPRAALLEGEWHLYRGRPAGAVRAWRDSLAAARRLAMPYEEARALLALGTRLIASSKSTEAEEGIRLVRQAEAAFVRLEATFDASRAMQILGEHGVEAARADSSLPGARVGFTS